MILKNRKYIYLSIFLMLCLVFTVSIVFLLNKDNNLGNVNFEQKGSKSKNFEQESKLPEITYFAANPSDTFIIRPEDYSKIERAHPYNGSSLSCAHSGGHIHFTNNGAPYSVDVIAPADGYVSQILDCFEVGGSDKFDIVLAIGKQNDKVISMIMSIEPFAGKICNGDSKFFEKYLKVVPNQEVKKGDVLLSFPKFDTNNSSAHIHFNLIGEITEEQQGIVKDFCPNIFDSTVTNAFGQMYGNETCNGEPYTEATFCNTPSAGQDIIGL